MRLGDGDVEGGNGGRVPLVWWLVAVVDFLRVAMEEERKRFLAGMASKEGNGKKQVPVRGMTSKKGDDRSNPLPAGMASKEGNGNSSSPFGE